MNYSRMISLGIKLGMKLLTGLKTSMPRNKDYKLFAPEEYWKLTAEDRRQLTNGCGTRGIGGALVSDTVWRLDITAACNIHDYMYGQGKNITDKETADRAFLNNMIRIIEGESGVVLLRILRSYRAMSYYAAVRDFGGPAFWAHKNRPEEMGRIL